MKKLVLKLKESVFAVFPISALVILLALTPIAKMDGYTILSFIIGSVMLVLGMGLFTLGVDLSIMQMGDAMGSSLVRTRKWGLIIAVTFVVGFAVAFAEPGLGVLADQLVSVLNKWLLLACVGIGVGFCFTMAMIKTLFNIPLNRIILISYGLVFALAFILELLGKTKFLALAFDSGGSVTGAITVPFIMAFGIGVSSINADEESSDSFGYIALSIVGAIIAVLLLGAFSDTESLTIVPEQTEIALINFIKYLPTYMGEIAIPLGLVLGIFLIFQFTIIKMSLRSLRRVLIGYLYTYVGLVIFLTGANVGFLPIGNLLGALIASHEWAFMLIPVGICVGFLIVLAEPSIHILNEQVEQISGGTIKKGNMLLTLMVGIGASIGLAMIRILTGISIWWFLIPGYALAMGLTFFTPKVFSAIAFDSGGVASGLMTASFLLPFALGASQALGGDILTEAFGLIAYVSMTPLIAIQLMGVIASKKSKASAKSIATVQPDDYQIIELD